MPEVASQTLDFVGRELNLTLAEARTALENYVEQPDNVTLLERCTQELHQVQGVLRVLEIYGAALLAEEMEQVASYLLATATERKSQAESLDALMRAMVQLPSYLERVLAGGRDLALVLLPLLKRSARGARQRPAVRRHVATAQLEVRQTGAADRGRTWRAAVDGGTVGPASARPLPGRPHRLDPGRAH